MRLLQCSSRPEGLDMQDLAYLVAGCAFFFVAGLYVFACERI